MTQALRDRIPACSQGTMNNLAIGAEEWAYYETIGGGSGGGPTTDGSSGLHTHMTNTRNTPAEALEIEFPLRVRRYELRSSSGGPGRHKGGDGVVREIECLAPAARLSLMTERRTYGPPGAAGGGAGLPGRNLLLRGAEARNLPSKCLTELRGGDIVRVETPGGGGWGRAKVQGREKSP